MLTLLRDVSMAPNAVHDFDVGRVAGVGAVFGETPDAGENGWIRFAGDRRLCQWGDSELKYWQRSSGVSLAALIPTPAMLPYVAGITKITPPRDSDLSFDRFKTSPSTPPTVVSFISTEIV